MKTSKNVGSRILGVTLSAAMTFTALPSTVFTANADNGISPAGSNTVTAGANDQYYFFAQPEDIDLRETETGLATAAVSFDYVKALLIDTNGREYEEVYPNEENPNVVNFEVDRFLTDKQLKIRVYYSETGYIDTNVFTVIAYIVTYNPLQVTLSNTDHKGTAVFETNFEPKSAEVYFSGGAYIRDAVVEGNKVTVPLTENEEDKEVEVHIYYGTYATDYITSYVSVIKPFVPEFDGYILNTVIPEGEHETTVCSELSFGCDKFEVYCGDEVIYTSPKDTAFDWKIMAPISEEYIGKELFIRAYFLIEKDEPYVVVDSDTFHVVKASSKHHFIKQPNDMDITKDSVTKLSWAVDFSPMETEIIWDGSLYSSLDDPRTNFLSVYDWFSNYSSGDYRIRAYYGAGAEDYVDSAVFHSVAPEFIFGPAGGYVTEGEKMNIEWDTNFEPVKLELWADDDFCQTLDKDAGSATIDGSDGLYYYIKAYYLDEEDACICSESFNITHTNKPIYNISIDENIYLYNMTAGSNSLTAVEGDRIYVCYIGDRKTFDRWDGMFTGVEFGYENDIETSFFMPANDVTVRYLKKASAPDGILGDVNGSGKIDITDITLTAAHVKGKRLLTSEQMNRADINRDGKITVADISRIAAHVKGKKLIVQD
jgi:hypothetical protein